MSNNWGKEALTISRTNPTLNCWVEVHNWHDFHYRSITSLGTEHESMHVSDTDTHTTNIGEVSNSKDKFSKSLLAYYEDKKQILYIIKNI